MKHRSVYASVHDAVKGIVHVVRSEKNMRIHLALGLLVIILASVLGVPRVESMVLILTIGIMFVAELVNTAIEEVVNLITRDYHPLAGIIKNVSAGAVLVAALTAVCIGYLVFIDYFLHLDGLLFRQRLPLHYLIVLAVVTVSLVIIAWKATAQDGVRRGAMPSGHTAVAFAFAVAIWQTSQGLPVLAGFVLAGLVGHSKVEAKIHNWWEVLTGACVGSLLALLFFRLRF